MNITKIDLVNFRCYSRFSIDKFSNINIIIGSNGIGKTSIIESIYIGSLAKTFKSNDDLSIIKFNKNYSKISIKLYSDFTYKYLDYYIDSTGKKTKINDKLIPKLSNFISQYSVLLLSPDEVRLVKASPLIRRNYLNIQLSQINKFYLKYLNDYNVLIKDKNQFLKRINNNSDFTYLDIIDDKIADLGLKIYQYRQEYINYINLYIQNNFKNFNKKDTVFVKYESDFDSGDKDIILKVLKKNRQKEIMLGMSTIGIHRDDFIFLHNGVNSKEYSSQGTQKLIVLSMKLSEIEIFKMKYNINPIILLDDLFSELDVTNKNKIFKLLDSNSQVFITTTDIKNIDINIIKKAKIYNLDERKFI